MQTLIVETDKTTVLPVFKNPDGSFEVVYENFTRTYTHENLKNAFEGGALVDDGRVLYLVLPKTPQEDADWLTPVDFYLQEFKVNGEYVEYWMRINKDDVWTPIHVSKKGLNSVKETLTFDEFYRRKVLSENPPVDETLHYSDYFYRVHSTREYVELARFNNDEAITDSIEWL